MLRKVFLPLAIAFFLVSAPAPITLAGSTPTSCYPPLTLVTNSIPPATAGSYYNVSLAAHGGQPPYQWSFGQSSLPQGFSIDSSGDVTGTAPTAGTYTFNVIVSDALKSNITGQLTLLVTANNSPLTTPPPTTPVPPTLPTRPTPPTKPTPPPTTPQPPVTPPKNPVDPPTTPTGPVTGTALTACQHLTKSGTYYLANDVSSAGTCFALGADNITLNLNGHTITYGTGGGSAPAPAFSACDSWYTSLSSAQCLGGGHNALTVYGGQIVQSPNAPPFSHVFWIGQGNGTGNTYIHDLTATFQSTGSQFYYGDIDGGGNRIQNNVVNDNVTNIQQPGQTPLGARAHFQGYVIHTDQERTGTPKPDDISGNTFNGSPQGGVADGVAGSQIYNNIIKLTSGYSNDYGVIVTMDNQNVHDNTITGRGRGLDGESSGFIMDHNTINVAEGTNNTEYNGCELNGTYGIRVKNYDWPNSTETGVSPSTNFKITNNTVTVPATSCPSTGLDLTDMSSNVAGTISGNTFNAPAGPGGLADALGFEGVDNPNITFQQNKFSGPTCILIGGEGDIPFGAFSVQSGQTWDCSTGPTVVAQDYSYGQSPASFPVLTVQDSIQNPTVSCQSYSTATVNIGSNFKTTCSRKGN